MIDKNTFDGSLQTKGAFFKKTNLSAVQDQISNAVLKYLDPKKKNVQSNLTQERPCLVCGSTERQTIFYKNCFPHVRCTKCDFVYVNPILREDELVKYYRGVEGSWADITETPEYTVFQKQYYNFHVDNIEKISKVKSKSILDVGCNNGEFLMEARQRGWEVAGHELNNYAVQRARSKKIDVVDEPFSAAAFKGRKFGAVSFLGVLEHVPRPGYLIEQAKELLEPEGVLAVLVPNIDCLATRILHEKSNTFDGIEHINFWGRETFEKFLNRHGYIMTHSETTITELFTLDNFLRYNPPYSPDGGGKVLLDFLTPEYIHKNFLGHHLCCYAVPAK